MYCSSCGFDLGLYPSKEEGLCPNCGAKINTSAPQVSSVAGAVEKDYVSNFFNMLKEILLRPSEFFSSRASDISKSKGLPQALVFAVVIHWFAAAFNFMYRSLVGMFFQESVEDAFRVTGVLLDLGEEWVNALSSFREQMMGFLFGAGMIILKPFSILIHLLLTAAFVHLAVWLFIPKGEGNRFSTTLKITAYAAAPWVFCVVPGVGTLLAYIFSFFVCLIGIREVYKTTTGRATLIVLFPELLLLSFLFLILFMGLFFAAYVLHLVF